MLLSHTNGGLLSSLLYLGLMMACHHFSNLMDILLIVQKKRQHCWPILVFDGKQSDQVLTLPHSCHPKAKLTTIAFRSGENERLMLDLDPYGGSGPDGIFPLTAHFLAPKIGVIFRKWTRVGWQVQPVLEESQYYFNL